VREGKRELGEVSEHAKAETSPNDRERPPLPLPPLTQVGVCSEEGIECPGLVPPGHEFRGRVSEKPTHVGPGKVDSSQIEGEEHGESGLEVRPVSPWGRRERANEGTETLKRETEETPKRDPKERPQRETPKRYTKGRHQTVRDQRGERERERDSNLLSPVHTAPYLCDPAKKGLKKNSREIERFLVKYSSPKIPGEDKRPYGRGASPRKPLVCRHVLNLETKSDGSATKRIPGLVKTRTVYIPYTLWMSLCSTVPLR